MNGPILNRATNTKPTACKATPHCQGCNGFYCPARPATSQQQSHSDAPALADTRIQIGPLDV